METMTINELAAFTGYSVRTLYDKVAAGEIPVHRPLGRKLVFYRSDIEKMMKKSYQPTQQEILQKLRSAKKGDKR